MKTIARSGPMFLFSILVSSYSPISAHGDDGWTFSWHQSEVTDLAFSPDGVRLYSTSLRDDRISQMKISDDSTTAFGSSLGKITGTRSHAVAVSPDGKKIAVAGFRSTAVFASENGMELWTIETPLQQYSPPFVMALVFSPNGSQLALSGSSSKVGGRHGYRGGLITVMNAQTGEKIRQFDDLSHVAESIAFSPNGKLFAAGTNGAGGELPEPGELHVWDADSGKLLRTLRASTRIQPGENRASATGIAFSPDSATIAVASSDGTVRLWDVAAGTVARTLNGHEREVRRVAYSSNGKWLASAGQDRTVRVWDVQFGNQVARLNVDAPKVNAVVFSPDVSWLAVGGGDFLRSGKVRVWQLKNILK